MVKVGFIVEGDTEKLLLESQNFRSFLAELKLDFVQEITNVIGNGNLLPRNIKEHSEILQGKGANVIIILTDLDEDACVTETKKRIKPLNNHICIVSKKKIESWFLADITTLRTVVEENIRSYEAPEDVIEPFEEINRIKYEIRGRGINNKRKLAMSMIENGFSFQRAATHPNCSSIRYFVEKLKSLSEKV